MEKSKRKVKVYIDDKEVEVPETATILDAANIAGAYIPTLCYHSSLDPLGACRICLVEVEGNADPITACNTFVSDGMKIFTSSTRIAEARKRNLKLILINHPLECPICDKGGECELQRIVWELGTTDEELTIEKINMKIDRVSPLIARYDTRCIRCGRCVMVCEQIRGFGAYEFYDTGYEARVRPKASEILNCEFCGACVDVCPVGAILSAMFLHKERVWNLNKTEGVCGQCGSACAIINETNRELIYRVKPDLNRHRYKGQLCHRGYFGYDYVHSPQRMLMPQIRSKEKYQPITLNNALDELVRNIIAIKDKHGEESVGFILSERLCNEEIISISELANKLGIRCVGSLSDFGPSKIFADPYRPYIRATFEDVAAADAVIIVGDFEYEMPSAALRVVEADQNDAYVVRASFRSAKLSKFARDNFAILPGNETAFLWAVCRALLEISKEQVTVENLDIISELKSMALSDWAVPLEIDESRLLSLAKKILASERLVIVIGRNLQYGQHAESAISAACLILELANKSKSEGSGILLSIDRANLRGILEFLGGFNNLWDAINAGTLKAIVSFDADPLFEFPITRQLAKKFDNLEFVCTTTMFEGPLTRRANLVIPSKATSEKSGSVLSADGFMVEFKKALSGPEHALSTFDLVNEIAQRIFGEQIFSSVELAASKARDVLKKNSTRRSPLKLVSPVLPKVISTNKFMLVRAPELFHVSRYTPYATGPKTLVPEPYVAISELTAGKLGIVPSQKVMLVADGVSVSAKVKIDPTLMDGAIFVPDSFFEPPFYLLTEGSFLAEVEIAK